MKGVLQRRSMKRYLVTAGLLLAPLPAAANDGFYFGGHVGYLFGTATATLGDPTGVAVGRRHATRSASCSAACRAAGRLRCRRAGCWASSSTSPSWTRATARRSCPIARPGTATADEQLEYLGTAARPAGLRDGRVDAVRDRRPRLRQHALLAHRPHHRQRGRQRPATWRLGYTFGGGVDYRARPALDGARRVSLHQPAA